MFLNSHSDVAFPGFLDGGGTFDAQTADLMFEQSRIDAESDLESGLTDTNAPEKAGASNGDVTNPNFINKRNLEEIPIEDVINQVLANVNFTSENLFDQEDINEDAIREDTINEDTSSQEAADKTTEFDFFYYNGTWYRHTTDVSPELETLAQDVWAGRLDLTPGSNQTSDAPSVAKKAQEDDADLHSQPESQTTYIRQDTPIPDWYKQDEDKEPSQDHGQTTSSRTITPTIERGETEPPSSEKVKIRPSKIVQRKEYEGAIFVCEIPGCNKGFLHLQYLRKHQRSMHTPMDHRWRVMRPES
ncbi:hypothetical protein yc1106_02764 [Curvularia clavata]|uniref:C2H2-type domain-containing protein n=1 Tax=Curvularia clavata TaxID=95742 RepID=A0A9Q9DQW8_CURCL|nr:hypothetical protein yc1106_02764 [Curvularia clavata]